MLGPSIGYIDLVDQHVIETKMKEQREPPKYNPLRASAAGYCERALGYSYVEYLGKGSYPKEEIRPDTVRLLDLGGSVEYSFIRQLQFTKLFQIKFKQQALTFVELSPGNLIDGSIDFCLYFQEHKCVADVKSKGTRFSSYRGDSWEQIDAELMELSSVERINDRVYWIEDLDFFMRQCNDDFMKDNFYQLNLYACSPFLKQHGVDHAVLFYYEKNKSRLREIRFKPSEAVSESVKSKFKRVHAVATNADISISDALPCLTRESELGSIRCSYCRFATECRPGIDTKQAYFDTWPERKLPVDILDCSVDSGVINGAYNIIKASVSLQSTRDAAEQTICTFMEREKIRKIKFLDGEIYECKLLKSPKPHFELRRSK